MIRSWTVLALTGTLVASVVVAEKVALDEATLIAAAGGEQAIVAVEAIRYEGRFELFGRGDTPVRSGHHETLLVVPDRTRQTRTFDDTGERLVRLLDRDRGLVASASGEMELDGAMLDELREYVVHQYLSLLHVFVDGDVVFTGQVTRRDDHPERVWRKARHGEQALWCGLDIETGRLVALEHSEANADNPDGQRYRQTFSDFRAVAGVMLPHQIESFIDGKPYSRRMQDTAVANPPVDDRMFSHAGVVGAETN